MWSPTAFETDDAFGGGGLASPTRVVNRSSFFLFVGTSAFIYEGVMALCLPLWSVLPTLERREAFPRLFVTILTCVTGLYLGFGGLNWLAYGDGTAMVSMLETSKRAVSPLAHAFTSLCITSFAPLAPEHRYLPLIFLRDRGKQQSRQHTPQPWYLVSHCNSFPPCKS